RPRRGTDSLVGDRVRWAPGWMDWLRAPGRRGSSRGRRLRDGVHPDRDIADPRRGEPDGDDSDDAGTGNDVDATAHLRVGRARYVRSDGAGCTGAGRHDV